MSYFVPDSEQMIPVFVLGIADCLYILRDCEHILQRSKASGHDKLRSRKTSTFHHSDYLAVEVAVYQEHRREGVRDCEDVETLVDRNASSRTLLFILASAPKA
jgi:hypothetical protein